MRKYIVSHSTRLVIWLILAEIFSMTTDKYVASVCAVTNVAIFMDVWNDWRKELGKDD